MEQRWNERKGETGDLRENLLTSGIVRHDSQMRKSGSEPAAGASARGCTTSTGQPSCSPGGRVTRPGSRLYKTDTMAVRGHLEPARPSDAIEGGPPGQWSEIRRRPQPPPAVVRKLQEDLTISAPVWVQKMNSRKSCKMGDRGLDEPHSAGRCLYRDQKLQVRGNHHIFSKLLGQPSFGLFCGDATSERTTFLSAQATFTTVNKTHSELPSRASYGDRSFDVLPDSAVKEIPKRMRSEVWSNTRTPDLGKLEIPEKTRQPVASSGTIPTCEIPGSYPAGIVDCHFPPTHTVVARFITDIAATNEHDDGVKYALRPRISIVNYNFTTTEAIITKFIT
ncbi:hypothetical protein PR048_032083 [Dryococelus australis]|uniref:Uncharacterized protein n=1 Tax=Dryococelus australis TaxID=614101 RepID=A0ABQ9G185_9NEOP|nr:hypothetical protein PR048_032083 [Dryococelus australis]